MALNPAPRTETPLRFARRPEDTATRSRLLAFRILAVLEDPRSFARREGPALSRPVLELTP